MTSAEPRAGLATSRLLLVSGLPGTGKTTYTNWLTHRGWGRFSVDEINLMPSGLAGAWSAAFGGDDRALLAEAQTYPNGLAIEWGFHTANLKALASMIQRGYNAWYFDGDRDAALISWSAAHHRAQGDDRDWRDQVARLDAAWPKLVELYGSKIFVTLEPGPVHLPPEEIHRRLELP